MFNKLILYVRYHQYPNRTVKAFKSGETPFLIYGKQDKSLCSTKYSKPINGESEDFLSNGVLYVMEEFNGVRTTFFENGDIFVNGTDGSSIEYYPDGSAVFYTYTPKRMLVGRGGATYDERGFSYTNTRFYYKSGVNKTQYPSDCRTYFSYPNGTTANLNWATRRM